MTSCLMVYVTTRDLAEAERIGRAVVEERLAACVNILPGMRSIYRWQGKIEAGDECVLIAKTRAALFDALAARVRVLHSYSCPCIVALPLAAGVPDYLDWIRQATEASPSS